MQQRSVRELMVTDSDHVVQQAALLKDVALQLIVSDCDVFAVTNSDRQFCGIVTESSVVRALMANPSETATIESIMCRHAESVRIDASLNSVLPLFRSAANTAIPVVDYDGGVCGILMRRSVIGSLLNRRIDAGTGDEVRREHTARTSVPQNPMQRESVNSSAAVVPASPDRISNPSSSGAGHQDSAVPPKPRFLKAEEARRVLWAAEDRL